MFQMQIKTKYTPATQNCIVSMVTLDRERTEIVHPGVLNLMILTLISRIAANRCLALVPHWHVDLIIAARMLIVIIIVEITNERYLLRIGISINRSLIRVFIQIKKNILFCLSYLIGFFFITVFTRLGVVVPS